MQDFFHQPYKVSPTVLEEPSHVVASGDEAPSAPSSDAPVPSVGLGWSCNANIFGFLGLFGTLWRNILRILRYCWVCLDFWDILRCYVNMCNGSISINCILCDLSMPNHLVPKSPFAFGSFKHTDMIYIYIYINIHIYIIVYTDLYTWNTWTNLLPVWPTVKTKGLAAICFNSFSLWSCFWVELHQQTHQIHQRLAFQAFFLSKIWSGKLQCFEWGFHQVEHKTTEKTGPNWTDCDFVIQKARINCWKKEGFGGAKNIPKLEAGQTARSFFVGTSKGSSRNPSRKLKNLNVPSYEALVSFGPYTHRISVETYFFGVLPSKAGSNQRLYSLREDWRVTNHWVT